MGRQSKGIMRMLSPPTEIALWPFNFSIQGFFFRYTMQKLRKGLSISRMYMHVQSFILIFGIGELSGVWQATVQIHDSLKEIQL